MNNQRNRAERTISIVILLVGLSLCVGLTTNTSAQPVFRWSHVQDVFGKNDYINDVAVDAAGNIYVAGWATTSNYDKNILVAKYGPEGNLVWQQYYDHGGNDEAVAIAVQGSSLYITGKSQASAGADDDIVSFVIDTNGQTALGGANEHRFDFAGQHHDERPVRIIPAASGVFFVGGSHVDATTGTDHFLVLKYGPGSSHREVEYTSGGAMVDMRMVDDSIIYVTGTSGSAVFTTIKYDTQLSEEWVRTYAHAGYDQPTAMCADRAGVYVTGRSRSYCGDFDVATVMYRPDGVQQWEARSFECASSQVSGGGVAADNNYVYVTGYHANGSEFYKYDKQTGVIVLRPQSPVQSYWNSVQIAHGSGRVYVAGSRLFFDEPYNCWHLAEFDSGLVRIADVLIDGSGNLFTNAMATMKPSNFDSSLVLVGSTTLGGQTDYMIVKYGIGRTCLIGEIENDPLAVAPEAGPSDYRLDQNYPNPFNPTTFVTFSLREAGRVSLKLYDVLGREIRSVIDDRFMESGPHESEINISGLSGGVYFYRLVTDNGAVSLTRKMVLAK